MNSLDDFRSRARVVSLLLVDVDGVLTDGGLYYFGDSGVALRFDVRDGLGIKLAQRAGIEVGLVSGRDVPVVRRRAAELGIAEVHLGCTDKGAMVKTIIERRGLAPEQVAFVGDDLIDLPAMEVVGLPIAVADAASAVRHLAAWSTRLPGGHGAVREVVEYLLSARDPLA
jgi:3-deoxy-D-manno-octulosonate 8-phosphate phosphatase (KDO 8-P phosphatase)